MYERFTDRARKVILLANQEAQRLHHEYIGTEHILLGLIKGDEGVAVNVLKNLDINLRKIRREIENIAQPGPEMVTMDKVPQTPRAKKVIEYAIEEARALNHNHPGTEHLLLGLLREEEGVAAQVLMNLGLQLEDAREEVLNLLGHEVIQEENVAEGKTLARARPPGSAYAARIAFLSARYLDVFADTHRLGRAGTEYLFLLDPATNLQRRPNAAFVSNARWPADRPLPHTEPWPVVPELAVEVTSKTNTAEEVLVRIQDYFRAGVQLVWIIFPVPGLVQVYESPTRVRILQRHEELDGGSVLPAFRLPVATLF